MNLRQRLQVWIELWQRYLSVFRDSWQHRQELSLPKFKANEAEFLPAALALQAQPVSPLGRWVARILIALIAVLLLWSFFGQIDIIVNATGKIIPAGRTKTIASVEVASVRALHVREGQVVKAGDLLVELDARASNSERDKAEVDELAARIQAARSRALLAAIDTGEPARLAMIEGVSTERRQEAQRHLQDQWADFVAKRKRLDDEIQYYAETLPLVTRRAEDYAQLAQDHDVSEHAYLEKKQAQIELAGQLSDARNQRTALTAETRKTVQDTLIEAERVLADSAQDARRANVHSELLQLVAPVDGTVQQLTVHTIGGVVPAAQPLMEIVPKQRIVAVEAFLENKDVGFVREGQHAEVKIDAFEYTKYGTIPARVMHVSRDAIQNDKKDWVYSVKIMLDRATMDVDGRQVTLMPGMTANVEIKTGKRRLIEYVLSPLIQHERESLHER